MAKHRIRLTIRSDHQTGLQYPLTPRRLRPRSEPPFSYRKELIMHASAQVEMQTFTVTVEFSTGVEPYATETYTVEAPDWYRRSAEHTSELQSLMRISYAVFCWRQQTNPEH